MLVSQALMSAPEISLILATGGPQMVSAPLQLCVLQ